MAGVRYTSSKVDEKLQIDLCRILNEVKYGLREKSEGLLTSGDTVCNTIDKSTNEKLYVPTSKYKQDKEGAESEIRDMIKNCWYEWLDGSKSDMFRSYAFSEGCFTCYTFKIKENAKDITFYSLKQSMDEPYLSKDKSDKCSEIGGFWRLKCEPGEKSVPSKKTPPGTDYKCCIKDIRNECENRGGKCSSQGKPSEEYGLYDKWLCPNKDQSCYVKKDEIYSYTRYIREHGQKGGEIYFMPPGGEQATNINYIPGEIYAISFVSPNEQICLKGAEPGAGCYAKVGGYAIGIAVGGVVLAKFATVGGIVTFVGKSLLSMIGIKGVLTIGAYKIGILDNLLKGTANFVVSGVTEEVPNFIIVSTLNDAKEIGCTVSYPN